MISSWASAEYHSSGRSCRLNGKGALVTQAAETNTGSMGRSSTPACLHFMVDALAGTADECA